MFELASRVYQMCDFNHQMEELEKINSNAHDYLIDVDILKWTRTHSPVNCYHMKTTNIAKSMNSALRFSCKLPIWTLMEFVHSLMQKWFHDKCNHAKTSTFPLTDVAYEFLTDSIESSHCIDAKLVDNILYLVKDECKDVIVNLIEKTCTCWKFEFKLLPYRHAITAIRHLIY